MKTTIHWRTILMKAIGLSLIVLSLVKMSNNPVFFSFTLALGAIFLMAGKVVILKIDDHEIRLDKYYLNGTINKTEVIKIEKIEKVEFVEGRRHLEDIFLLGALPEKDPDKLILHKTQSESSEYELHFYKSEVKQFLEILHRNMKTAAQ